MSLNSEFFNKINQENQQRDNFVKSNLIREQIKFLFPNLKKDDYDILLSLSILLTQTWLVIQAISGLQ